MAYKAADNPKPVLDRDNVLALIEGDMVIYRVVMAQDEEVEWKLVKRALQDYVYKILNATNAAYYIGFIEGEGNFRKDITKDHPFVGIYKKERPPKPGWYTKAVSYLKNTWGFHIVEKIETDDAICICSKFFRKTKVFTEIGWRDLFPVVCHNDKDYYQIVGVSYNVPTDTWYVIDALGEVHIEQKEKKSPTKIKGVGARFFWHQMLCGDKADTVTGIERIRKQYVVDLLMSTDDLLELHNLVLREYFKKFGTDEGKERFDINFKLLRLLREPAYGFKIPEPLPYGTTPKIVKYIELE